MVDCTGEISMVGAGMAGFCDGSRGIVHESPNLPGVKDLHLAEELSNGFGLPAFVENDATAAAWGEFLFGDNKGIRHMLAVTLGTGIGGGLVLDGRLYRGARGFAGEIGHVPYDPQGPDCPCGGKGCLERFIGREPFEREYLLLAGLTDIVEPKIIHDRARQGDKAAREAWDAYGHRLGVALAGATNFFDLGAVILSGGISGAWESFEIAMRSAFNMYLITPLKGRVKITRSGLEGNAGLLGAAFLDRANEGQRN